MHARDLSLEARHAGAHNLVDEEKVAGDDSAGVYHLFLDPDVVVDTLLGGDTRLSTLTIQPNLGIINLYYQIIK